MSTIPIWFEGNPESEDEVLGVLSPGAGGGVRDIDVGTVKKSLSGLAGKLSEILGDIRSVGDFQLETAQLAVQVNAEGGVSLVANAKAGVSGTITLTFSRGKH